MRLSWSRTGTASLSIAACIVFFIACSSSDEATPGGGDGSSSGGTSGKGSSGNNGEGGAASSSGSGTSSGGASSSGDAAVDPDPPVPVGDGSLGAGCNKNEECKSNICAVGHKCVVAPSCKGSSRASDTPGVDTCGKSEPGDESCCTTLTLPTTTTRTLDKYEITSGRIRAFVESLPDKNLRKWVKDYAAKNPSSELGKMVTQFPGYEDVIPAKSGVDFDTDETTLPVWLGAFPNDAINPQDGCYVGPDIFGASTYWQDPAVLKQYGIGYPPKNNPDGDAEGKRLYSQAVLDKKSANCMPPVLLAAFCAWDGGELARTSDYWEIWGHTQETLGANEFGASGAKFTSPWATTTLKPGEFNWRNGHGGACPLPGWPGCDPNASEDNPPATFFSFPKGGNPGDDDSPEIGAPGRFPKDVTKKKSPDGGGWLDVGGNMLEAAWPNNKDAFPTAVKNYCNTTKALDPGDPGYCNRDVAASASEPAEPRPGTTLFPGTPPTVALIGASFEGHITYGENYFANPTDDETKLLGYGFAAHFQYGKVSGRCARVKK